VDGSVQRRAAAGAIVAVAVVAALALARSRGGDDQGARCGPGFEARGALCVVPAADAGGGVSAASCPAPLVRGPHGCDAPDVHVLVPATSMAIGPSDWEAEGRVAPRTLHVQAFCIDAFEVTRGRWGRTDDVARAESAMTRAAAAAFCASHGGRLPTEDEWIVAAASAANPPRRYPWGDTGAVCRRAAWGLASGPCARGADGADTVGAHPDGDSPLGLHDLAGNVAEWVAPSPTAANGVLGAGPRSKDGIAKGGSWASSLAADLRIWARLELSPDARDPRVGLRCVYPP